MAGSLLDRRAAVFALIYLAIGGLVFAPVWKETVLAVGTEEIVILWPLALPMWGAARGAELAAEAGRIAGALLGMTLIPLVMLALSWLVDRIVR